MRDLTTELGRLERIAVFGGIYNNSLAFDALLADAEQRGAQEIFFLGDVGGFGPHPDRAVQRLRDSRVYSMQGNYDDSVGNGLPDCQCGYTHPRDNHFAQLSYDYTLRNTDAHNRAWLRDLPTGFRVQLGTQRLLMAHGSPRRVNEFLWASTTPVPFIERLLRENETELILVTHSGMHWQRRLDDGRGVVNVGAIGRPANDGATHVWYALLSAGPDGAVEVEFVPLPYDHERLAREMEAEGLPSEFVETIRTGWWTTCLEILPSKERATSRY